MYNCRPLTFLTKLLFEEVANNGVEHFQEDVQVWEMKYSFGKHEGAGSFHYKIIKHFCFQIIRRYKLFSCKYSVRVENPWKMFTTTGREVMERKGHFL